MIKRDIIIKISVVSLLTVAFLTLSADGARAGCSGNFRCGSYVSIKTCRDSGDPCVTRNDCDILAGDICISAATCSYTGATDRSCIGEYSSQCVVGYPNLICALDTCISKNCSWSAAGATPTPSCASAGTCVNEGGDCCAGTRIVSDEGCASEKNYKCVLQTVLDSYCSSGWYCQGDRVLDEPTGCLGKDTPENPYPYCQQGYERTTILCDDTCANPVTVYPDMKCVDADRCSVDDYEIITGCCAPAGGTPPPVPTQPLSTPVPSCTVDLLPASASISTGLSASFIASVVPANGTVSSVSFSSFNPSVASVSPASDASVIYQTEATGVAEGSTTIQADAIMDGSIRCFDTSNIVVAASGPWWQTKDSDITTGGNLISSINPAGVDLILDGDGGYPGVAVYGGASASFGNGSVSSKGWLANSTSPFLTVRTYDYSYFKGNVPDNWWDGKTTTPDTIDAVDYFRTEGSAVEGYKIFYHMGDLAVDAAQDLLGVRAILFVEGGDLTINGDINLTDGGGFFMAIVGKDDEGNKGRILVNPLATSLEGFYLAESLFETGAGSVQLVVRGSVVGLDGVLMQRDLGADNATTPAELFEYAPDLIFTFPPKLMTRKMRWKEVAP